MVSMNPFNYITTKSPSRHRNHLTPVNTMSFNFGGIYPIFCRTVLPGDRWSMAVQTFVRSVPLLSPVMHRNDIKIDAFYVPFRLIWKSAPDWHQCIDEDIKRPMVLVDSNQSDQQKLETYSKWFGESSIMDYLGFASIPASKLSDLSIPVTDRKVCALPLRAYTLIYDWYYRNKAVEDSIEDIFTTRDWYGDNDVKITFMDSYLLTNRGFNKGIFMRSWRRDIFTSALPDPQNGSDILIPQADIVSDGPMVFQDSDETTSTTDEGTLLRSEYVIPSGSNSAMENAYILGQQADVDPTKDQIPMDYKSGLKNDPSGPTIRQLRTAGYLEQFEEAMARSGGNKDFKAWLRGIWHVKSSDARLDRPEYLGGYRGPIQISEIPQTSSATESSPQGTLAGKGLSVGGNRLFRRCYFEEPGILMVTMSVVPKSAYCQGDPREWLYDSPFDFPNPYLDCLGEQEVKEQEINALAGLDDNAPKTFGYNMRNYEMKHFPDEIHGACRSSLAYWHEGRIFDWDTYPGLNPDFVKVKPDDVSRIFPSQETSDKLIGQFFFDIRLKRNLNWYGISKYGAI